MENRNDPAARFFDASPEMLCVLDREARVVRGNRAWTAVMGAFEGDERLLARAPEAAQADWLREQLQRSGPADWSGQLRTAAGGLEGFVLSWGPDEDGLLHAVARRLGAGLLADRSVERARALMDQSRLLRAVLDNSPIVLWTLDSQGRFTLSKGSGLQHFKLAEGEIVGESVFEAYKEHENVLEAVRATMAGASLSYRSEIAGRTWYNHLTPIPEGDGEANGVLGVSFDVTQQTRLEAELREHIAALEQQRGTIRALSTPVLTVWNGVLALPLIGHVDEARAEAIMDTLLAEITRTGSRHAILDVTGVDALDTTTVHHVVRMLRAVALLGAEGILTGVRPAVAQGLVGLGGEMPEVLTLRNLQAGLEHCVRGVGRSSRGP